MVPLAERFPEWNDFPKGLHVLVVDKNKSLLNDVKLKLEAWDYVVTAFDNETDAFAALQNQSNEFHMLLIEVPSNAEANDFKLLQAAENVPTILMTDTEDMAIMMQGIALGASDFLQKPISDEKLKSIWQHVARKAISAARLPLPASFQSQKSENSKDVSISFEPLTRRTASDRFSEPATPQLQQVERISSPAYALEDSFNSSDGVLNNTEVDHFEDYFTMPDEYAEQRSDGRDRADESCHSCSDAFEQLQSELYAEFELGDNFDDFTLSSNLMVDENVIAELDTESNILSEMSVRNLNMIDCMDNAQAQEADAIEEEALLLAEVAKAEKKCKDVRSQLCKKQQQTGSNGKDGSREDHNKQKRADATIDERGKSNKRCVAGNRKMKVDWTAELHRRFVQAVEQLGVEKAIPSRILEIMGVESLTRHNVASHLQKYRSHRRHLEARDTEGTNWSYNSSGNLDGGSWTKTRREGGNSWSSSTSHHSSLLPIQPKPPIRCSPIHLAPPPHVWGHPTLMWQKPNIAALAPAGGTWQASQQAAFPDAWGHPVPVPGTPCYLQPIMSIPLVPRPGIANMTVDPAGVPGDVDRLGCGLETGRNSDFDPPQETVDAAINEVLKDPWAPLPLGLKPPSLDSVMSELQRQGITSALPILASS